jgi:hypothetical protein
VNAAPEQCLKEKKMTVVKKKDPEVCKELANRVIAQVKYRK